MRTFQICIFYIFILFFSFLLSDTKVYARTFAKEEIIQECRNVI